MHIHNGRAESAFRRRLLATAAMTSVVSLIVVITPHAEEVPAAATAQQAAASPDVPEQVTVTGQPLSPMLNPGGVSPEIQKFAPPQTIESIDQRKVEDTTNAIDVEDAIKYLPSVFLRKRNNGDTQPTLETRTWGVNSSARSLVFVDDIPISALISNNNTTGSPRWGMVSPEEITGIDMLYGPFAAEYPGNSMGGVLLITTQMPDRLQVTGKQTGAIQTFDWYKTRGSYGTSNSAATIGDKLGRFSWFLSADREDSSSQPLFFITNGSSPTGTSGTIPAVSKTGTAANVVGAGGLLHSVMDNVTGKAALDLTDWLRATYMIGYWDNDTHSDVQSYLASANGAATFGGVSGFASDYYHLQETHLMNVVSLKTDTKGDWDGEAVYTRYDYLNDIQLNPSGVTPTGTSFKTTGLVTSLNGTGWSTEDLKGIWRPTGINGAHQVSFGAHRDEYVLNNPTYNANTWTTAPDTGNGSLSTSGRGKTETYALWAQDAWTFYPDWKLTLGGRLERWRAYDGFNLAGGVAATQPTVRSTNFSPKATLAWQIDPAWGAKLSFGEAYRYPTVSELYQIVSTGGTFAVPNPNLTPENVYSEELAIERRVRDSRIRLSLFQEYTKNALISQTNLINGTYTTTFQNVAKIRNRGFEVVAEQDNVLIDGLDLSDSITFVDSKTLSDPTFQSATGTTATGKRVPYVPDWRNTAQATYRPSEELAFSVAARYQGKMYSTLDNTDTVSHVFGGFDKFFVVDTHVHYQINDLVSAEAGIDNIFDAKYFEYHPFPSRTYVASVKLKL